MLTKKNKILLFALGVVVGLIVSYIPSFINKKEEDVILVEQKEPSFKYDSTKELIDTLYAGNLSASQVQEEINNHLDYSPDFTQRKDSETLDETSIKERGNEDEEETKETDELLTAYLDNLLLQRNKLNKIVERLNSELLTFDQNLDDETEIRDEVLEIKNLDSPLVKGLLVEMKDTPFFLNLDNDIYTVRIDYDKLNEQYAGYFNDFHKNLVKMHKDVVRFGYTRSDGEIDAKAIYNRLLLIDEIQDGDVSKDDYYWENERYQLAVLYTGFGAENLPKWDDERIKQMTEIFSMNETIDDDKKIGKSYLKVTKKILDSMKKEGKYRDKTMRIANDWMNNEFSEYKKHLKEKEDKEKVEVTAQDEEKMTEDK